MSKSVPQSKLRDDALDARPLVRLLPSPPPPPRFDEIGSATEHRGSSVQLVLKNGARQAFHTSKASTLTDMLERFIAESQSVSTARWRGGGGGRPGTGGSRARDVGVLSAPECIGLPSASESSTPFCTPNRHFFILFRHIATDFVTIPLGLNRGSHYELVHTCLTKRATV